MSGQSGVSEGDPASAFLDQLSAEEKELMLQDGAVFPSPDTILTAETITELKKIRRKARNKQSARLSRMKNQQKVKELEELILKTDSENAMKRKEITDLERRNMELRMMVGGLPTMGEQQAMDTSTSPAMHPGGPYVTQAYSVNTGYPMQTDPPGMVHNPGAGGAPHPGASNF
jgi:hypothetical protein